MPDTVDITLTFSVKLSAKPYDKDIFTSLRGAIDDVIGAESSEVREWARQWLDQNVETIG